MHIFSHYIKVFEFPLAAFSFTKNHAEGETFKENFIAVNKILFQK